MKSTNETNEDPSAQREGAIQGTAEAPTWHRPLISRIEIAQTLHGGITDGDDADFASHPHS